MSNQRKKDIILVDDSETIAILLADFLKKLGYNKIHHARNGKEAIQKFTEVSNLNNSSPIVFLDYNLPDMSAFSVFSQLIRNKPDSKVIVVSATSRDDISIKQLISAGAYNYLQKPIRFENLKDVINVLEMEEGLEESKSEEFERQIESLIKSSSKISLERLTQYTNTESKIMTAYLEKLESDGKIMRLKDTKEVSCKLCGSVKISQEFHCPSCNNSNFKQGKLIEHYSCGNVSLSESYQDDVCPKCHKKIKILGVDHKVLENYYVCIDCGEKFSELPFDFLCLKCNNKFKLEQASWKTSPSFKSIN